MTRKQDPDPEFNSFPELHRVVQITNPKTSSENGLFVKEDMNTYKCALLLFIVIIICILLYRIGNGGNKLFVFVFVGI
jgi:hypothetical protein